MDLRQEMEYAHVLWSLQPIPFELFAMFRWSLDSKIEISLRALVITQIRPVEVNA